MVIKQELGLPMLHGLSYITGIARLRIAEMPRPQPQKGISNSRLLNKSTTMADTFGQV